MANVSTLTWGLVLLVLLGTGFSALVEALNLSRLEPEVPPEFKELYDSERYRRAQDYLKIRTRADLVRSALSAAALVAMIVLGGFDWVDGVAREWGSGSSLRTGLAFAGLLGLMSFLFSLPFRIHHTFVIESRFGFNRTTPAVFAVDLLKGVVLALLLGAPIFAGLQWFFESTGEKAWWLAWLAMTAAQLVLTFLAPVVLLPLFNKFEPLPSGELRESIEEFARAQRFKLGGIFRMDGSKRSSKANAYFTGFGRFRRIVLFDTLIQAHPKDELVAVLAHEIGHYQEKHIPRQMILSVLSAGAMLFLLSLFVGSPLIFEAFRMSGASVYASLILFSIVYAPVSRLISLYGLYLSRRHEFEADAYSLRTYPKAGALASALKRLSVENLSNLKPHPLKVFMDYTHPPVLERLRRL